MKDFIEGSAAIAEAVARCRPGVISAYPITPQTHIVEGLAEMVAAGRLDCQFVNVESEHSAASLVLGAAAAGARVFSASSSQGLILMSEVLFNIAGMRMPVVMVCVNRALSAPINIWNDQQDSMSVRDSGWVQLYAESNQEAADLVIQAYRLAEDSRAMVPVMVCMDGFILSHGLEVVDNPEQEQVDRYLPPFRPEEKLDVEKPLSFGLLGGPDYYLEIRDLDHAVRGCLDLIPVVAAEFKKVFGRDSGGLVEAYRLEDASRVIVAAGSVCGTIKETVDAMREEGEKVGLLRVIAYRPFPGDAICRELADAEEVAVLDKAISLGATGPIYADLRSEAHGKLSQHKISGFVAGLGGRDITQETIREIFRKLSGKEVSAEFIGLK